MAWQKDKGFKNFVCAHSTVRVYLPFSMTGSLFREGGCSKKRLSFSLASRNATTYTPFTSPKGRFFTLTNYDFPRMD